MLARVVQKPLGVSLFRNRTADFQGRSLQEHDLPHLILRQSVSTQAD